MLYHAGKFEKILRVDPVREAYIILGHNWANIAHLAQKKIFWEIYQSEFYQLIVHY